MSGLFTGPRRTSTAMQRLHVLAVLCRLSATEDPTTDEVRAECSLVSSKYDNDRLVYVRLCALAEDGEVIRTPRQHERVMRWAPTAIGQDTIDRTRAILDENVESWIENGKHYSGVKR